MIQVTAQYGTDYSIHKHYYTEDVDTYDKVSDTESLRANKKAWFHSVDSRDRVFCGKFAALNDLL